MFRKKGVLENFANFTGKQLRRNPFFNKIAAYNFYKKIDSDTDAFLWILPNFQKYLLYRIPSVAASGNIKKDLLSEKEF